jgi:hypothetical protein
MRRTIIFVSLLIAAITLAGCKPRGLKRAVRAARPAVNNNQSEPKSEPLAPKPEPAPAPKIRVIVDPAQVAAAKQTFADHQEKRLNQLLNDPDEVNFKDPEIRELMKQNKDKALKALSTLRDNSSKNAYQRIQAMAVLRSLGQPADPTKIVEVANSSKEARDAILMSFETLVDRNAPLPPPLQAIVMNAVDSNEPHISAHGNALLCRYLMPEQMENFQTRMKNGDVNQALPAAIARIRPDKESFDLLVTRIGNVIEIEKQFLVLGLCNIAEWTKDPALREAALEKVVAQMKSTPDTKYAAGVQIRAMYSLSAIKPPEKAKAMLVDILKGGQHKQVRGVAFQELSKYDQALALKTAKEANFKVYVLDVATPTKNVGDTQAVALLVKHGLLTQKEADQGLAVFKKHSAKPTDPNADGPPATALRGILWGAYRYIAFNARAGYESARHDLLIRDIADASNGKFKPEAVHETYTAPRSFNDKPKYSVQFISAGKLYRFEPQTHQWIDIPSVLAAVNKACSDAGLAETYIPIDSESHFAEFVFANQKKFESASSDLGLTIATNPDKFQKEDADDE